MDRQPLLDNIFPYSSGIASTSQARITGDSPYTPFTKFPDTAEISQSFDATMYLMWDPAIRTDGQNCTPATVTDVGVPSPSTCDSIPVPLGYVKWIYSGDAVDTLYSPLGDNGTTVHLLGSQRSANSFVSDSKYPEWDGVVSNVPLKQGSNCVPQ
jgi:hypothetical protein